MSEEMEQKFPGAKGDFKFGPCPDCEDECDGEFPCEMWRDCIYGGGAGENVAKRYCRTCVNRPRNSRWCHEQIQEDGSCTGYSH